jgi:hypothetical protein
VISPRGPARCHSIRPQALPIIGARAMLPELSEGSFFTGHRLVGGGRHELGSGDRASGLTLTMSLADGSEANPTAGTGTE